MAKKTASVRARTAKPKKARASTAKKAPAKKSSAKKSSAKKSPAKKKSARASGLTVDAWVTKSKAPMRALAAEIVAWMSEASPVLTSSIKWGQPVWEGHGPLAWLNTSSGHATFGFWRGAELVDSDGILEGVGARMRHVKLAPGELTPAMRARLAALLRQAVDLNVAKGDPTRRKPA